MCVLTEGFLVVSERGPGAHRERTESWVEEEDRVGGTARIYGAVWMDGVGITKSVRFRGGQLGTDTPTQPMVSPGPVSWPESRNSNSLRRAWPVREGFLEKAGLQGRLQGAGKDRPFRGQESHTAAAKAWRLTWMKG